MSNLTVIKIDDSLVVDSRLIAEDLGIKHKNLFQNIRNHQTAIEYFGQLRFKNETVYNSVGAGNEVAFCYLNEEQATFVMTLSRNTPKVIKCKQNLVRAFSDAKKVIKDHLVPTCQILNEELQNLRQQLAKAQRPAESGQFQLHCDKLQTTYRYTLAVRVSETQYIELMYYTLPEWIAQEPDPDKFMLFHRAAIEPITELMRMLNRMSREFTPIGKPAITRYATR
jgi:phage regulator Rha-like protein